MMQNVAMYNRAWSITFRMDH